MTRITLFKLYVTACSSQQLNRKLNYLTYPTTVKFFYAKLSKAFLYEPHFAHGGLSCWNRNDMTHYMKLVYLSRLHGCMLDFIYLLTVGVAEIVQLIN